MIRARFPILFVCAAALCLAQKAPLTPTWLPGGSSISVPAGWKVSPVNGMVSAEGPEGEVDLGINVSAYTPQAAAAMPFRPPVVAPYGDAAQSALTMLGSFWKVPPQSIRIIDRAPIPSWTNGPAVSVHLVAASVRRECLLTVMTGPVGPGEFMYYHSGACAAPEQFAANLPLLLRIWSSWKVGDRIYQARLRDAACSLRSIAEIIRRVNRRRERAFENANEAWDEIMRNY